jgi:uncharacterized membrane protein/protein-disulfide isomerase
MSRRTAIGLLVFCLLGLVVSGLSAYVHYRLLTEPGYTSFCSINATWNCETVYQSRFGTFRGIPVAVAGVIWFMGATMLAAASWRGATRRAAPAPARTSKAGRTSVGADPRDRFTDYAPLYLFAWSVIGLAFVMYFGYASFIVLKAVCMLCLMTYVSVIAIFILSGSGTDLSMRSLPGRALRDLRALMTSPAALVAVLLFAAFAASAVAFFPRAAEPISEEAGQVAAPPATLSAAQQAEFEKYYVSQPRVPLPVASDGAKVVIVKFNDFMCPPCKQTYMEYKPVLAKWQATRPGLVKFILKDYPLDPACNANTPQGQHLGSCEAAVAVRLARERNRADEMEEWLFQNQATMSRATARQGAREIGRVTNFEERFPSVIELVKGDIALGAQLHVTGTPTFFVNGVKLPGLQPQYFNAAIEYELKQAGVK